MIASCRTIVTVYPVKSANPTKGRRHSNQVGLYYFYCIIYVIGAFWSLREDAPTLVDIGPRSTHVRNPRATLIIFWFLVLCMLMCGMKKGLTFLFPLFNVWKTHIISLPFQHCVIETLSFLFKTSHYRILFVYYVTMVIQRLFEYSMH